MRGDNDSFLTSQFVTLIVLAVIAGLYFAISGMAQAHDHSQLKTRSVATVNRNALWLYMAGQTPKTDPYLILHSNDAWFRLANDVKPLMGNPSFEGLPKTALLPTDLASIQVGSQQYPKLHNQLQYNVFQGDPVQDSAHRTMSANCVDCGKFTTDFLQKLTIIQSGHASTLLEPVPPYPTAFYFTPADISLGWFFLALAALASLLGVGIGAIAAEGWIELDDPARGFIYMFGWAVFVPLALPGMMKWMWTHHKEKESKSAEDRRKMQALKNNPVADELYAARERLARMETYSKTEPGIVKAIRDTKALITELENFPNELSHRAEILLAAQALKDNEDARLKPKAILDSRSELGV